MLFHLRVTLALCSRVGFAVLPAVVDFIVKGFENFFWLKGSSLCCLFTIISSSDIVLSDILFTFFGVAPGAVFLSLFCIVFGSSALSSLVGEITEEKAPIPPSLILFPLMSEHCGVTSAIWLF